MVKKCEKGRKERKEGGREDGRKEIRKCVATFGISFHKWGPKNPLWLPPWLLPPQNAVSREIRKSLVRGTLSSSDLV